METQFTYEVEIAEDIMTMAGTIYQFLLERSMNPDINTNSWFGPAVIQMFMGIPPEDEPLFIRGFWLLVIQGLVERHDTGVLAGDSFRLKAT